jgi:hypothetical protein
MSGNTLGTLFTVATFGESHGPATQGREEEKVEISSLFRDSFVTAARRAHHDWR